ncbi:MAG: YdcF family protein [Eubacterium sp.]|nr:YdcF family protein [Eubacterium sp.]
MKNKTLTILISGYLIIAVLTWIVVILAGRTYDLYIPNAEKSENIVIEYSQEGIIELKDRSYKNGYTHLTFKSLRKGNVNLSTTIHHINTDENGLYTTYYSDIKVTPLKTIIISGVDFCGYQYLCLGFAIIDLFTMIVFIKQFRYRKKHQFFSYRTVIDLTIAIFFTMQFMILSSIFAANTLFPYIVDAYMMYNFAGLATSIIFIASLPISLAFAGFLAVSNLVLIKKEGLGKNNLFAFFISAIIITGSVLCILLLIKNPNSVSATLTDATQTAMRCIVSSLFIYFQLLLFSTLYCTFYASRHEPKRNQDFIIILGCQIRKDGTPLPLLQGRIDRAIEFYNKQIDETGKQTHFIASGGQGSDEIIPEAQSIKNYLVSKGIDESLIYTEEKSTNTLENMLFSKEIADSVKKNSNILFSTTNYHIFRSGIYSAKANMQADGIGAKTKWYFWPNAQIREFIGLNANEFLINLLFDAIAIGTTVCVSNLPSIINLIFR